ncbi:hypothetical protein QUH73_18985 [Labilibaculum sp. K2S]|uniref:hypothetical protein n=1 Tax=Labilibaculum sp. K2S TaxID=3056386 RepID=UPI0025A4AFC4|nr:hypothetical protein [Labilibaculum sp. K2S]MDM8161910.1 hypothetical protein [Labilibaculum sp. K2S]
MKRIEQCWEKRKKIKKKQPDVRRLQEPREERKISLKKIMTSSIGTTIIRELTRGILGVFGI